MSAHLFRWWVALGAAFIVGGLGYGLRPVEAQEPARVESMAEVVGAVIEGCIRSGGTWANSVEDGRITGKCFPIERVAVVPVPNGGRK